MAKILTGQGNVGSVSNVRSTARPGATWRGFAAGLQPRRGQASKNTAAWAWVTRGWPNLEPEEQAAWNAIATGSMSGFALYTQAGMRAARRGQTVVPAAPTSVPTFQLISAPSIVVVCENLSVQATWTWTGTGTQPVSIQASLPQRPNQLYTHKRSMFAIAEVDAADGAALLTNNWFEVFGQIPTNCSHTVTWTHVDQDSGIAGPVLTTRFAFGVCV